MNTSTRARRIASLVAALLFVPVLIVPSASAARPDGGNGTRQVAFSSTAQVLGFDSACDPTVPTRCAGTFRTIRTYTGDLSGTAFVVGSSALLADGTYQGQDIAQFTGLVEGCGTGTLMLIETGILDPATGNESGTWTITSGQGSGDLTHVSGSGTSDTSEGGATGTLRCV